MRSLTLLLLGWAGVAQAQALTVESATVAPAAAGASVAIHLVLQNTGPALELTGASTPLAQRATVRVHHTEDSVTQILTPNHVTLPASSRVHLQPGGTEVFLLQLKQPLVAGNEFPLLLTLQPSQTLVVRVRVAEVVSTAR
jgi:copper(I)-binding protein